MGKGAVALTLLLFVTSNCYVQQLLTTCEARGGPCGSSFFLQLETRPEEEKEEEKEEGKEEERNAEGEAERSTLRTLPIDTSKRERRPERNATLVLQLTPQHQDARPQVPRTNETRRRRRDAPATPARAAPNIRTPAPAPAPAPSTSREPARQTASARSSSGNGRPPITASLRNGSLSNAASYAARPLSDAKAQHATAAPRNSRSRGLL